MADQAPMTDAEESALLARQRDEVLARCAVREADPTPTAAVVDTDDLPPTQYLILEVLAARYRTGEQTWTFPSKVRHHLDALAKAGLIGCKSGVVYGTALAWFTDAGRRAALLDGYEPVAVKDAYAAGYAQAITRLRDDERYRHWWSSTSKVLPNRPIRRHLADYLETIGVDHD